MINNRLLKYKSGQDQEANKQGTLRSVRQITQQELIYNIIKNNRLTGVHVFCTQFFIRQVFKVGFEMKIRICVVSMNRFSVNDFAVERF